MSQAAENAHPSNPDDAGFDFGAASSGKLGMWIFLLTDAMSFGGLLLGYAIMRSGSHNWVDPATRLGVPFTAGMTFLLICSSVTMVLALAGAQDKNKKQMLFWLGLTILGGIMFLCGQAKEYHELMHEKHMGLSTDQMASSFFLITGFHGMHVTTGVIYLIVMFFQGLKGKFTDGPKASPNHLEIAGLFWHFVDLVWILVFTFVYLI
jgi:cytochrome c oxidase subunit III